MVFGCSRLYHSNKERSLNLLCNEHKNLKGNNKLHLNFFKFIYLHFYKCFCCLMNTKLIEWMQDRTAFLSLMESLSEIILGL